MKSSLLLSLKLFLCLLLYLSGGVVLGQYFVGFEGSGETKTGYASGNVTLSGIQWNLTETLIGTSANDFKNGARSARLRAYNGAIMSMIQNKANGIGVVSFQYRVFGTDTGQQPWAVEYSLDNGSTWTQIGVNIIATTTVQTFSETVNQMGAVRLRIRLTTTPGSTGDRRMNIDDINITDFTIAAPEINVQGNALDIPNGGAGTPAIGNSTDFGNAEAGTGFADRVFTIQNTGTANLTVGAITFAGAAAADFSIVAAPAATVAAGGSTTFFTVRFAPSVLGVRNATISIVNNDSDENPYTFNLRGTGTTSNQSDIIITPAFVYPVNIPYINYQATDITPANIGISAIEIAQFTIRDGGGTNDNDALPTILNNLNFSVATCGAIRRLAIYEGATEIQEITPTCAFANFSGLNLSAPDNGSRTFRVIASFVASPITDGSQIRLSVVSATVAAGSSLFVATNAGGAQSSIAGNNNRLNVIADRLAFVQNTSNAGINATMLPLPSVAAVDANGNRDLSFAGLVSITSTGTLDASPKTVAATSGLATFSNIIHTVAGTGFTLNATAAGLTGITSNTFAILNQTSFLPGDLMFVGFDNQISGADDKISIVTMVDILPGTTFIYANAVYEVGANANQRTGRWYACNGSANSLPESFDITYTGAVTIPAGAIICFIVSGTQPSAASFTVNGVASSFSVARSANSSSGGAANMSTSDPDAVFLMQGAWTDNGTFATFNGTILGGIQQGGTWYSITDDLSSLPIGNERRRSRIPPQIDCFAVQATTTVGRSFAYYNGPKTSNTQPAHINNIINFTGNWNSSMGTTGDDLPANSCDDAFVITTPGIAGRWTGASDSNWFNCRNWDNFSVPTATTDVRIASTATNPILISSSATNADLYFATLDGAQRVAECRNLVIDRLAVIVEGNASPINRLDIHGNLTISGTGSLDMDDGLPTPDGLINLLGNWNNTLSDAAFAQGNGTLRFVGTSPQSITTAGGSETFHNITFNNTAGITLNNTNALVSGTATFTNGVLNADNAATARLEFLNNALVTEASADGYVNGWVRKVGNQAFTFPLGDAGFYAPAGISAPALATDHFTATYRRVSPNPFDINQKAISLDHVGNCEYWIIDRSNGISNVNVTLSYDDVRSCGITAGQEGDLRVARWDGSLWQNEGNININTTANTITSNIINNFSPFTLASTTTFNPLPVELLNFEARLLPNGQAELRWQTLQEINNAGFEVQRATDARKFQAIGFVNAGGSNGLQAYTFIDPLFAQEAYYRLRQIDLDGSASYSKVLHLKATSPLSQWQLFPNPTRSGMYIKHAGETPTTVQMQLVDARGTVRYRYQGTWQGLQEALYREVEKLPIGLYVLQINTERERFQQKLVKE